MVTIANKINYNLDEKSQLLEIKCKNLQKIAKFLKDLGIKRHFGRNGCPMCKPLQCLGEILISFHILYFMEKFCLVLKLCHFKVYSA